MGGRDKFEETSHLNSQNYKIIEVKFVLFYTFKQLFEFIIYQTGT